MKNSSDMLRALRVGLANLHLVHNLPHATHLVVPDFFYFSDRSRSIRLDELDPIQHQASNGIYPVPLESLVRHHGDGIFLLFFATGHATWGGVACRDCGSWHPETL